jgi:hypothetical protein
MWWQTGSTVECVFRSANIRRFAIMVSVWTQCLTITSARKAVHVCMGCVVMHKEISCHEYCLR